MKTRNALFALGFALLLLGCFLEDDNFPNNSVGAAARDLLSNERYTELQLEIAYAQGFKPTQEALDNFKAFIEEVTVKEVITFRETPLPPTGAQSLSTDDVRALEAENRTAYPFGATVAVYIYFADAPSALDEETHAGRLVTLGAAYGSTSMVIFEPAVRNLVQQSASISIADVETATLNHELGHLLGLVDLGSPAVNAHEDRNAPHHCNVQDCLMQSTLTFGSTLLEIMERRALQRVDVVPKLDTQCRVDLYNNGGSPFSH